MTLGKGDLANGKGIDAGIQKPDQFSREHRQGQTSFKEIFGFSLRFFTHDDNVNGIVKEPVEGHAPCAQPAESRTPRSFAESLLRLFPVSRVLGQIKQVGKDQGQRGIDREIFMGKFQQSQ